MPPVLSPFCRKPGDIGQGSAHQGLTTGIFGRNRLGRVDPQGPGDLAKAGAPVLGHQPQQPAIVLGQVNIGHAEPTILVRQVNIDELGPGDPHGRQSSIKAYTGATAKSAGNPCAMVQARR